MPEAPGRGEASAVAYLRTTAAIRERCGRVLAAGGAHEPPAFAVRGAPAPARPPPPAPARERWGRLLAAGLADELPDFEVRAGALEGAADFVAAVTRQRLPHLKAPVASPPGHFGAGGVPA